MKILQQEETFLNTAIANLVTTNVETLGVLHKLEITMTDGKFATAILTSLMLFNF